MSITFFAALLAVAYGFGDGSTVSSKHAVVTYTGINGKNATAVANTVDAALMVYRDQLGRRNWSRLHLHRRCGGGFVRVP